jgi:hypothetical protein
MVDRTDIDALLIGALYGELTPADEARLSAHLASHPADRTALEDLTHTRDAVRASGLRTVWLEPPQAVSARVLQEAARRAKPARESWFHRFVRSLTAHPALAAAMTIVVVAGVASTLYVRRADKFDEVAERDRLAVAAQSQPAPMATPAAPVAPPVEQRAAEGAFAAGSAAAGGAAEPAAHAQPESDVKAPAPQKPRPVAKSRAPSGITVESRALEPKDLDDESRMVETAKTAAPAKKLAKEDDRALRRQAVGSSAGDSAPSRNEGPSAGFAAPQGYATPPVGAVAPAAAAPAPAAPPPPAEIAADKADGGAVGWAERQRDQVIAYVRANNCRAAAAAAVEIYNRAPDFYASNIATDREVKPCLAYVTSERERVDRARAAKRGNAEPSSPATSDPAPPPARK